MAFELMAGGRAILRDQAAGHVLALNDLTARHGLSLTHAQAMALVQVCERALAECGRIELGGGTIGRIVRAFCDSPYLTRDNYAQTVGELIDAFYYYKNETRDLIGDDALIEYMKAAFDGACQGSVELLIGRALHRLARSVRAGYQMEADDD